MLRSRSARRSRNSAPATRSLMVRLDPQSKSYLYQAAQLRHISISDYVRTVMVAQARRELHASHEQTIALTPEEQLEFWNALSEAPRLTEAQRRLGAIMRGED
ncbi:MAG: DUF1778 domain-containing protein [Acidobacteriota bacterium]